MGVEPCGDHFAVGGVAGGLEEYEVAVGDEGVYHGRALDAEREDVLAVPGERRGQVYGVEAVRGVGGSVRDLEGFAGGDAAHDWDAENVALGAAQSFADELDAAGDLRLAPEIAHGLELCRL